MSRQEPWVKECREKGQGRSDDAECENEAIQIVLSVFPYS